MRVYAAAEDNPGTVRTHAKDDGSPLTEADRRSHEYIVRALHERFASIPVVSEEDDPAPGKTGPSGACWVVDPLDGTKEFLKRSGEFTVNIGYVEAGVPLAGVVVAPVTGDVWFAHPGGAWRRRGTTVEPLAVRACPDGLPRAVVASRDHAGPAVREMLAALPHAETLAVGSSLKFCRVAEGNADLYFRDGPTMPWDTAAAHAVLRAAGGEVYGLDGTPLTYHDPRMRNAPFVAVGDLTLPWRRWIPSLAS